MSLQGKIIVVTGGSGLLGQLYCQAIMAAGGTAINADLRCANNLDAHEYGLDITSIDSVRACVAAVIERFGQLDGWVNNAYPRTKDWGARFEDIPLESWRQNVDMHLNGYFACCQVALEAMRAQGHGVLINLASIYGIVGPDFSIYEGTPMTMPAGYAAIKGALVNLTRYLAAYYGPHGVRVNTVSPGGIFDNQPASFVEKYEAKVPLRRLGQPADIAPSIVFLLSDAARYITGHNLVIDGGWSII
ncbi:MAG: SDR family oxidoreductase [Hymenobacteraceae bacterium]|nr:SDR family oxidoreductase [Hymenobacteraceae bacterium]